MKVNPTLATLLRLGHQNTNSKSCFTIARHVTFGQTWRSPIDMDLSLPESLKMACVPTSLFASSRRALVIFLF